MPKKNFTQNPALQFISGASNEIAQDNTQDTANTDYTYNAHNTTNTNNTVITNNTDITHDTLNNHNTDTAHNTPNTDTAPTRHPASRELKTKRLNLLIQPTVLSDISKIAHMRRTSANDLINSILREYAAANQEIVAEYDRVFGDNT